MQTPRHLAPVVVRSRSVLRQCARRKLSRTTSERSCDRRSVEAKAGCCRTCPFAECGFPGNLSSSMGRALASLRPSSWLPFSSILSDTEKEQRVKERCRRLGLQGSPPAFGSANACTKNSCTPCGNPLRGQQKSRSNFKFPQIAPSSQKED